MLHIISMLTLWYKGKLSRTEMLCGTDAPNIERCGLNAAHYLYNECFQADAANYLKTECCEWMLHIVSKFNSVEWMLHIISIFNAMKWMLHIISKFNAMEWMLPAHFLDIFLTLNVVE